MDVPSSDSLASIGDRYQTTEPKGDLVYRYCQEIAAARQNVTFDGSVQHNKCITKHGDFTLMVNAGFSIEFCTAVAVVVTGVTVIDMAKEVVCIVHVKRRHLREAWRPFLERPGTLSCPKSNSRNLIRLP